jgi:hypothetical protein
VLEPLLQQLSDPHSAATFSYEQEDWSQPEPGDGRVGVVPSVAASYQRRKVRVKWNTRDKQVAAVRMQVEVLLRVAAHPRSRTEGRSARLLPVRVGLAVGGESGKVRGRSESLAASLIPRG